jgi:WD40 repeat protein
MIKSPFKFLDSYTLADRNIFFGRDQEIAELYRRVFESKILLVYGVSGTGKSSLINCGLASRFDESDWLPLYIRRGSNIIDSLNDAINKQALTPLKKSQSVTDKLQSIYLDHFKPVYLLFDQFEEIFIFGNQEEKSAFIKLIKDITDSKIQCRIIFILREEFLAGMTDFRSELPDIFNNCFRVEKMRSTNAISAVEGPCRVNNIEVEAGFSEELIDKLCPSGIEIELTFLQIYLDRIFRIAVAEKKEDEKLKFSKELLTKAGSVSDLLGQFLEEQIREFDDPDTGMAILKSFVSVQGTKRQMNEPEILDAVKAFGTKINEQDLIKYLTKFVDLRILKERDEAGYYELRHDALAAKIYEKFTAIEKDIIEVRQFIENAYGNWRRRGLLLSADDLSYIAPYESKLYLSKEQSVLIEKSKNELARVKRRRRNIAIAGSITLLVVFASFTIWALIERNTAREQKSKVLAEYRHSKVLLLIAKAREANLTNPTKAIRYVQLAWKYDSTNVLATQTLSDIFNSADSKPFYTVSMGHKGYVQSAVFSPDGKSIVTASVDKTADLWDLKGKCIATLLGHTNYVNSAVFSPDGKSILTASSDNTAKLWDLSGKCLATLLGHTSDVISAFFSPDGKTILSVSYDLTAKLWDLSGKCLATLSGHSDNVNSAVFSRDGKSILTASDDKTAKLWDLSGKCLATLSGHSENVNSAVFSQDGKYILTASDDKTAKIWGLSGRCLTTLSGHSSYVRSAVFSSDGKFILTASKDNSAKLWNMAGKCLVTLSGHSAAVRSVIFSMDGKFILTASFDKTAKLWDLSGKCLATLSGHTSDVFCAFFSPDGKSILTASADNTAKLWDLSEKCLITLSGHSDRIISAAFSSDGRSIVTASNDETAKLWDLSGKCLVTFSGHLSDLWSAVFSPDGKSILTASDDKTAKLWDLSGKCLVTFSGHSSSVCSAVFSSDGKSILTASADKTVKLWDLSGKCMATLSGHSKAVLSAVFSPDCKSILTASEDRTAKLWDLSGKCLVTLSGHSDAVRSVVFSSDGKFILTASFDKTAKLWDLSGKCLVTLSGHSDPVWSAVFSPDGKSILTASEDRTAKLWNISGKCLVTLSGHSFFVFSAVFSPDGKSILTASGDNTAKLWFTPSSISKILSTAKIGLLSPEDKAEIDELDDFSVIKFSDNLSIIKEYADWYLKINDTAKAEILFERAIQLNHLSIDKKILGNIYRNQHKTAEYSALYKDNPGAIIKDDISALQDTSSDKNYAWKFDFYSKRAKLYEQLLKVESSLENKVNAASSYNSVGWNGLLSGRYNDALNAVQRGIELYPSNEHLYAKLPLCYLFTGLYDQAKSTFLEFKNKPWTVTNKYSTYREAFLADIAYMEKMGITHPDFEKIKELLKK